MRFGLRVVIVGWLALISCSSCSPIGATFERWSSRISKQPRGLPMHELKRLIGRYRMEKIIMTNSQEMSRVSFTPYEDKRVTIDTRQQLRFRGKRIRIRLDRTKSFLNISKLNICRFQWGFISSDKSIDVFKATLGRFKIGGDRETYGCLRYDRSMKAPKGLVPLKKVRFQKIGSLLIIRAKEGKLGEEIRYLKIKS